MTLLWSTDDFWAFSLRTYGRDSVKNCCLTLQDDAGLNVNIVLLCGYLNYLGVTLSDAGIRALFTHINDSDVQLKQHRVSRRAMKAIDTQNYHVLLEQELELERQQQALLINHLEFCVDFNASENNIEVLKRYAVGHMDIQLISPLDTLEQLQEQLNRTL